MYVQVDVFSSHNLSKHQKHGNALTSGSRIMFMAPRNAQY